MLVKIVKEKKYIDVRTNREITITRVFKDIVKPSETYSEVWQRLRKQAREWQEKVIETTMPQMKEPEVINIEEIFKNFA